jgi:hypothetical protein
MTRTGWMTRAGLAALIGTAAACAWAETAAAAVSGPPPEPRLNIVGVFAHATVPVQAIMAGLLAAALASLAIWAMQLAARTPSPRRLDFLSGLTAAAPLLGLAAAAYSLLNSCIGIANVRPAPDLTILAPGLAEALASVLLALLASAIALIARRHLESRSGGGPAREAAARGATALS